MLLLPERRMSDIKAAKMEVVLRDNEPYLCECGETHMMFPQNMCPKHYYPKGNCGGREGYGCYTQNGGQCPKCPEKYCGGCGCCVSCAAKVVIPPKCEHKVRAEPCPSCSNYHAEYGTYPCGGNEGYMCADCGHCSNCPISR